MTMRRNHWAALAGAGILLGCLLTVPPITGADPPAPSSDAPVDSQQETVNQLKEINAQLRELGTLLCSGKVRVIVVINPDAETK
jgi:hypothetical protein